MVKMAEEGDRVVLWARAEFPVRVLFYVSVHIEPSNAYLAGMAQCCAVRLHPTAGRRHC